MLKGASHPHMPHPRAPLDGRRVQPVDLQLFADLFQHAKLDLGMAAVGGDHVAGEGMGGLIQGSGWAARSRPSRSPAPGVMPVIRRIGWSTRRPLPLPFQRLATRHARGKR